MLKPLFKNLLLAALTTGFNVAAEANSPVDANSYLEQGQFGLALDKAQAALRQADSKSEQVRRYGELGSIQLQMHRYLDAEASLQQAFSLAESPAQKADYANNLGVLYHEAGIKAEQQRFFKLALELAGNDKALALKIKLNQLQSLSGPEMLAQAPQLLGEINAVESQTDRVRYAINLASSVIKQGSEGQAIAQNVLEKAQADGAKITDVSLRVELLDSLAELYELQGQDQRALELCEQATALAGQMPPDEVMIGLEWRKGRIYRRQGKEDYALAAFGKAVDNIQAIRLDIPVEYHDGKSSFRETLEPVYLGYADQLLKKAERQQGEAKQKTLVLARNAVEQIKQTEMEDFFGGRCLIEGLRQDMERSDLEAIDAHAAVLYPIILPDRLELLVSFGKTIRQYTVAVTQEQIREASVKLSESLRNGKGAFRVPAKSLYQWLISPLEKDLAAADMKTLVIVPDGVLRLVPFSALYDGHHYVLEKYAVSVSPGMSLMGRGEDLKARSNRSLLVGLSKPGPVIERLPSPMINAMLDPAAQEGAGRALTASAELSNAEMAGIKKREASLKAETLLRQPGAEQMLKDKLSLPGVEDELNNLKKTVQNTTLLNEQFTVDGLHRQLAGDGGYEIVHIASHGVFSGSADDSFLMAYDDVIKLDDLGAVLKRDQIGQAGIGLLTFSACETAEGDDRAPLGFTGAALRASAHSAMGSLWPISDQAASTLMTNFYANMTRSLGKSEALRQAQLKLLNDPKLSHPFYWSPFILVGNWI